MATPFAFKTYLSKEQVQSRAMVFSDILKTHVAASDTITTEAMIQKLPNLIEKPYPVVLITNGVATCGKDTFVKAITDYSSRYNGIAKLSTIDPVRDAGLILYKAMDTVRYLFSAPPKTAAEIVAEKGDEYRDLLYNIKCAWEKDESATRYSVGSILATLINDRGENLSAICIDSRETETIDRIVDMLTDSGLIVLKVLLEAPWTDQTKWENGCDHNVKTDHSYYDVVITNDSTPDDLRHCAWVFIKTLEELNHCYGVSSLGKTGDTAAMVLGDKPAAEEKEDSAISPMGFRDDSGSASCIETDRPELQPDGDLGIDTSHRIGDPIGDTLLDQM